MLESTAYGQQLGEMAFQGHLARLGNIAGITMPSVQQQTALLPSLGQQLGYQPNVLAGQARQSSIQNMSIAQQQAHNLSGNAEYGAATTNAQLQTQASIAQGQLQLQADMFNAQNRGGGIGSIAGSILGGLF
jgi:hypothetical protein